MSSIQKKSLLFLSLPMGKRHRGGAQGTGGEVGAVAEEEERGKQALGQHGAFLIHTQDLPFTLSL